MSNSSLEQINRRTLKRDRLERHFVENIMPTAISFVSQCIFQKDFPPEFYRELERLKKLNREYDEDLDGDGDGDDENVAIRVNPTHDSQYHVGSGPPHRSLSQHRTMLNERLRQLRSPYLD
jgi:hypothetical protein